MILLNLIYQYILLFNTIKTLIKNVQLTFKIPLTHLVIHDFIRFDLLQYALIKLNWI